MVEYLISLALHFLFISSTILLFFAPFVISFWYRHYSEINRVKPSLNQFSERFFKSPESNILILLWGACEAFIWWVLPEFLLFLVIFMKVKHKFDLLKYDLIGTVIGTIVGVYWHASNTFLATIPYIHQGMINQVNNWYETNGIMGLLHQPFSGVPFKVFTHLALDYNFSIILFVLIAVVVRMTRYAVAYAITRALYPVVSKFVQKNYWILFLVAVLIFTLLLMKISFAYS